MKSVRQFVFFWIVLALLANPAPAKQRRRQQAWGVPVVYSNLDLEPETGDVGGMEVILIPTYYGDWASVVVASGIAYDPVLVPVERNGAQITFTLPNSPPYDGYGTFKGTITRKGLVLRNENLGTQVLARQRC